MRTPNFKRNIKISIGKPTKFEMKYSKQNALNVVKKVMKEIKNA